MISWGIVMVTLPFSLFVCFKVRFDSLTADNHLSPPTPTACQCLSRLHSPLFQVVQEYERAVIFRLGRLLHGGSRGPGNR